MKRLRMLILGVCIVALFAAQVDLSFAATTPLKVSSSKGKVVTLTNGYTGYACKGKTLAKGSSVNAKKLNSSTKYARTLVYGINHNWSASKIASKLKSPKKYSVKIPEGWTFQKVYKGKKLRAIAYYVNKPVKKDTASSKDSTENAVLKDSATETPAVSTGTIEVSVTSSNPSEYSSDCYSLEGLAVCVSSDNGYRKHATTDSSGAANCSVPAGDYKVGFLMPEEWVEGGSPYVFGSYDVSVGKGATRQVDVVLEPVPGYIYLDTNEDTESAVVTGSNGKTFELSPDNDVCFDVYGNWVPADSYDVTVTFANGTVETEHNVQVMPGKYRSVEL